MNWIPLTNAETLDSIIAASAKKPQVIFKHSTRCSISVMSLQKFEKNDNEGVADCYLLDLLNYRAISNEIAERFKVHHESPQVLLIKNGECIYDESHMAIDWQELVNECNNQAAIQ